MCHRSADSQAGSVSHHRPCCVSRHQGENRRAQHPGILDGGGSDSAVIYEHIESGVEACFFFSFFIFFQPQVEVATVATRRCQGRTHNEHGGVVYRGRPRISRCTSSQRWRGGTGGGVGRGGKVPCRARFYGNLRKAVTRSGSFSQGLNSTLPQRRTCVRPVRPSTGPPSSI